MRRGFAVVVALGVACSAAPGLASSRFTRSAGPVRYELLCPDAGEASPLVIVAPHRHPREQDVEQRPGPGDLAETLVRAGFVVVAILAPPADARTYSDALATVLAAVRAGGMRDIPDPACRITTSIGIVGLGQGGAAALDVARGGVDVVVTAFVVETGGTLPRLGVPMLAFGLTPVANATHSIIVHGANDCDLVHVGTCTPRWRDRVETGSLWRRDLIAARTAMFLHAYLQHQADALASVVAWDREPTYPAPPRAAPASRPAWKVCNLSLLLGGTNQGAGGFVAGARPEALAVWKDRAGFGRGVGGYLGLAGANGHFVASAGASYASYFGRIGLAPSIGVYRRTAGELAAERGIEAGLFVGFRRPVVFDDVTPYGFDVAFGARVDVHFGAGGARDVLISAQLDTAAAIAAIVAGVAFLQHTPR